MKKFPNQFRVKGLLVLFLMAALEGVSGAGFAADLSANYHAVVAQDGSGNYRTVQEALDAAPDDNSRYRIYIKNGAYFEKLKITRENITLIGESVTGTRLFYNHCSSDAGGTSQSASMTVAGNGFCAENLSIQNTFDYDHNPAKNRQAVALLTQGDRLVFKNCRITGHQDTLNIRAPGRQYFENCYIEGHTDFIFGEGFAVFNNCTIYSIYRPGASITAPATPASKKYGFVFLNCNVTGAEGMVNSVYLGRPWHPSSAKEPVKSSAVFIRCHLGAHIADKGWTSMSGIQPGGERFAEYHNTGVGAALNESRSQLTDAEAADYTMDKLLGGEDHWDPTQLQH